jgi:MFS family permease
MQLVRQNRAKVFYGWWIVLASAILNLYTGGAFFYGFTAFIDPIVKEFSRAGWSYLAVSFAVSLRSIETGIIAPAIGFLVDRLGSRKLLIPGVIVAGSGYILLSRIQSLWSYYLAFLVVSLGLSACTSVVLMTVIAHWFRKKASRAMGLMVAGYGASGLLVPLVVWLIAQYQWRTALLILGIGMWGIGIPLSLVVRHKPEQYGYLPDGEETPGDNGVTSSSESLAEAGFTAREAAGKSAFWLLSIALSVQFMAVLALMTHLMPYLSSINISREIAGFAVTWLTLLSVAGRLGFGWMGDIIDKRYVLAIAFALQSLGMFLFALIGEAWQLIPFLLLFGPGYGGTIPLRAALQREYFGRKAFGAIQGLMLAVMTIGGIVGPPFAGWVFDVRQDYRLAWLLFAAITALVVPLVLAIQRPAIPRSVENQGDLL